DRIAAMVAGLSAMGAVVTEFEDGIEIEGPGRLEGARVESGGDHRIAMALAVAGLLAEGVTEVDRAECVDISDPGFWVQMDRLGGPMPRVNSLVDIANLMSLRLQVPVGLYDLDLVMGSELVIRLGQDGEGYEGIGKEKVNVAGRICVVDAVGPCGNPSADSAR